VLLGSRGSRGSDKATSRQVTMSSDYVLELAQVQGIGAGEHVGHGFNDGVQEADPSKENQCEKDEEPVLIEPEDDVLPTRWQKDCKETGAIQWGQWNEVEDG
jgi:hypothetical protein